MISPEHRQWLGLYGIMGLLASYPIARMVIRHELDRFGEQDVLDDLFGTILSAFVMGLIWPVGLPLVYFMTVTNESKIKKFLFRILKP